MQEQKNPHEPITGISKKYFQFEPVLPGGKTERYFQYRFSSIFMQDSGIYLLTPNRLTAVLADIGPFFDDLRAERAFPGKISFMYRFNGKVSFLLCNADIPVVLELRSFLILALWF